MLSLAGNTKTYGEIYQAAGPDIIESRSFYFVISDIFGVNRPDIIETPVKEHLDKHPEHAPFCCHRFYNLDKLQSVGATVPSTSIFEGLKTHVKSLLTSAR